MHGEQGYRDVQHVQAFLRVLLREREPGGGGAECCAAFGHERESGGLRGGFEIIYIKMPNLLAWLNTLRFNSADEFVKSNIINSMKTRVFNLIILDESGSMQSIKKEAIDSVNETVQTIRSAEKKNEDQEHFVSLVTFNNDVKTVYDCVPAKEVKELTSESYCPDCCTALYDAMGTSLNALRLQIAEKDRVLVTVVTDGYENSSREYTNKAIKALVDELKGKGWVFAYIGANHDVEQVAASISIANTIRFQATSAGTQAMTDSLNRCRKRIYAYMMKPDFSAEEANEHFFDDDEPQK